MQELLWVSCSMLVYVRLEATLVVLNSTFPLRALFSFGFGMQTTEACTKEGERKVFEMVRRKLDFGNEVLHQSRQ